MMSIGGVIAKRQYRGVEGCRDDVINGGVMEEMGVTADVGCR